MKRWIRLKGNHLWIAVPRGPELMATIALAVYVGIAIFGLMHSYNQQREPNQQRNESQEPAADGSQRTSDYEERRTENKTPEWYSASADWALVLIGTIAAWAAIRTLKSINRDVRASTKAAIAAKRSADTAEATLRLAATTFIELKGHSVQVGQDPLTNDLFLLAQYRIANTSNNIARHVQVYVRYGLGGAMDLTRNAVFPALGVAKGFWVPMPISGLTQDQVNALNSGMLSVRLQITIEWFDPLGGTGLNTLHRELIRRPNGWDSNVLMGAVDENPQS